jgi:hypothetical protein
MEITYASIQPLIVSEQADGMMIKLKFKAPGQETAVDAVAVITPDQKEIMNNTMKQAGKSAAVSGGVSILGRFLRMFTGKIGGVGGMVANEASYAATNVTSTAINQKMRASNDPMKTEITPAKREAAIVAAFSQLSMYYTWENGAWKYSPPGA